MRILAMSLALTGALTLTAPAAVLDDNGLLLGTALYSSNIANLLIDGPAGLFSLDTFGDDPLLTLNGLTDPLGDPYEAGDFTFLLEDQVTFDAYFGSGVDFESTTNRFDLLIERTSATGAFGSASQFLLVTITGSFGDALSLSNSFADIATVEVFGTVAVPLPATLPLLLAGLGALAVLRRRA